MDCKEELIHFLDINNSDKVLLLRGPWGIGKTYLVDKTLEQLDIREDSLAQRLWKCIRFWKKGGRSAIRLSLFGVSDVRELNFKLISEIFKIRHNAASLLGKINLKIGLWGSSSISLDPSSIVKAFDGWLGKKTKGKASFVLVIDDIERRDNKLSLDEIFGFVDQIRYTNVKTILIANAERLSTEPQFVNFKEKVVDKEIAMISQVEKIKRELFALDASIYERTKASEIVNLRVLQRFSNLIEESRCKNDVIDCLYLRVAKCALLAMEENKYTKEQALSQYLEDQRQYAAISREEFSAPQAEKTFLDRHRNASSADYFAECLDYEDDFACIVERKEFFHKIYNKVQYHEYDKIKDVPIHFSKSPYPNCKIDIDLLNTQEHDEAFLNKVIREFDGALNSECDKANLFYQMNNFQVANKQMEGWTPEIERSFSETLEKSIELVAGVFIKADYDPLRIPAMQSRLDHSRLTENEKKLYLRIQELLLESMKSFDYWTGAASSDWFIGKVLASQLDIKSNKDRFLASLKEACNSMMAYLREKANYLSPVSTFVRFVEHYPEIAAEIKNYLIETLDSQDDLPVKDTVKAIVPKN